MRAVYKKEFMIREDFFRVLVRIAFPAMLPVVGLGMWLLGFGAVTIVKFLAGFVFLCVVEYQGVKAFWAHFSRK